MMMKTVLKLGVNDDEEKKKVMATVCCLSGVDSFSMDLKDKKLTVIGDIDPVTIVIELRKLCHIEIVSVGPGPTPTLHLELESFSPCSYDYPPPPPPPPTKKQPRPEPKPDKPKTDEVSALVKSYKE